MIDVDVDDVVTCFHLLYARLRRARLRHWFFLLFFFVFVEVIVVRRSVVERLLLVEILVVFSVVVVVVERLTVPRGARLRLWWGRRWRRGVQARVITAVQSGVNELGDGVPWRGRVLEGGVVKGVFRVGHAHVGKARANAFHGLVEGCKVEVVAGGAGVENDGVNGYKAVAIGTGLARREANDAQFLSLAGYGVDYDVALTGACEGVQIADEILHRRHDERGGREALSTACVRFGCPEELEKEKTKSRSFD